jgi:FMN phosphatase YigB (HAD superfamily)
LSASRAHGARAVHQPAAGANGQVASWREDRFLLPVVDRLANTRLLSLDVFDTLLFRTWQRPEDVFLEVGRRAGAAGLLRRGIGAGEFASLRQTAQARTYATLGREPRLEDIYALLPVGPADALIAIEEAAEADAVVLNPSIDALVAECNAIGIPVVLLSDMYLGEQRVQALLARAGFDVDRRVSRLLVSVDQGGYKMTGALYQKLAGLFPTIPPAAMLHIGDNLRADVTSARAAGLHAVHYDVIRHDPDATLALEELVAGDRLPELASLRRLAGSLAGHRAPADARWFRTGAHVLGPFLAALVDWALDEAVADGITLIAPLMREGHLLAPMLRAAVDARGLDITIAPLYVSRQAVALAAVTDTRGQLLERLLDGRRQFTVGDLFALIGAAMPADLEPYGRTLTTSADTVQVAPGTSLRQRIATHLTTEPLQEHLADLVRAERSRLVRYLDGALAGHEKVATLDVGFFGQIQRSIDAVLRLEGRPVRCTHLFAFGHGPVADDALAGRDVRTFAGGYGGDADLVRTIHRSAPVLEQLLQGPEGSTVGYRVADRRAIPILEPNPLPASDLVHKTAVQEGVRVFHDLWLALRHTHGTLASRLVSRREAWCRLAHRLIAAPSHGESATLGTLHDDVNFGSRAVLPFCPPWADAHVSASGPTATVRRGAAALPVVWPQGVIARVDPTALIRRYAEASDRPYATLAHALACRVREADQACVIGYGTGEVAAAFIDAARIVGVEVAALVDSDPARHGLEVGGVRILSLDDAVAIDVHAFVVLSVAHAAPIADTIRRRYRGESLIPLIFEPGTTHSTR